MSDAESQTSVTPELEGKKENEEEVTDLSNR